MNFALLSAFAAQRLAMGDNQIIEASFKGRRFSSPGDVTEGEESELDATSSASRRRL